jgi:hypothetical protein
VIVTSSQQEIFAGLNFILRCTITLSMDVQEVLRSVSVNWIRPSNMSIMASNVQQLSENPLQYRTEIQINSSDAGSYSCGAQVMAINSPYLTQSSTRLNTTEIAISMTLCYYLSLYNYYLMHLFSSFSSFSSSANVDIYKLRFHAIYLDEGTC